MTKYFKDDKAEDKAIAEAELEAKAMMALYGLDDEPSLLSVAPTRGSSVLLLCFDVGGLFTSFTKDVATGDSLLKIYQEDDDGAN